MSILDLWKWDGRVSRKTYAIAGFLGFAIKHNMDRFTASAYGLKWGIWNYWIPFSDVMKPAALPPNEKQFLAVLLLTALPFVWVGVTMTLKRLRDAGQSLWLTILFFAPVVNLLFFALLCVMPSREAGAGLDSVFTRKKDAPGYWAETGLGSAALGVVIAAVLGIAVTWADLRLLGNYGLTLFIALPFVMGYVAVWVHCRSGYREPVDVIAVVSFAVLFAGLGL